MLTRGLPLFRSLGEVVWEARFKDMFASSTSGRVAIDLGRLHEIGRLT